MKIAFLTSEFPNLKAPASGGIGTSLVNLAKALLDEGVNVVIFMYGQEVDDVFIDNGIEIHLIKARHYGLLTWYKYRKFLQDYINREISKNHIDLFEAPDWTGITAFMKLKAPVVIRFHGSDAYFCNLAKRKQKLKNFLFEKMAINGAQGFIAPSEFAGKLTSKIFGINKPFKTIHYGLSLPDFQNENPTVFDKGLILYIGTIIRKKGVFELPEIFQMIAENLPEARLVLIGIDAPDVETGNKSTWQMIENSLDEDIRNRVSYLGKVPYGEVREYIKRANVCVFPTFAETMGMVTIESMAMSKAVVNSSIGWAQELIEDGISGYLVHPKDHALYADRVLRILQDEEHCIAIGKDARKRTELKFDIKKTVKENINFYKSFIKK